MAVICPDFNLLFIMSPRSGCNAVAQVLFEKLGGRFVVDHEIRDADGQFRLRQRHCTLGELLDHCAISPALRDRLTVFSTVRNPFDSLVSLYVKKATRYQTLLNDPNSWIHGLRGFADDIRYCGSHSFDEWIQKHYSVHPVRRLLGRGRNKKLCTRYIEGVDVVLRFESLEESFRDLLNGRELAGSWRLPHVNSTESRDCDYRRYYTRKSRRLIEYGLGRELIRLGYRF